MRSPRTGDGPTVATSVHVYPDPGERSPKLIHTLLTDSASQILCHLPSNHSTELLPTGMLLLGRGCLAEGQSSRFWRPPADRSECSRSWKAGKGQCDPDAHRAPLPPELKGLRCRTRLGGLGWVGRVHEAPQLGLSQAPETWK